MKASGNAYEPPKMNIYYFDDNEQILTASSGTGTGPTPTPDPSAEFAANALNNLFGGSNTTIEK